jgi:hypothetical protein
MACISITIGHSGSGDNAVIYFNATDGIRDLYGDRAYGWGGQGTPTDDEYKASVTAYVLEWFGKPVSELCGYVSPTTSGNVTIMVLITGVIFIYYLLRGK